MEVLSRFIFLATLLILVGYIPVETQAEGEPKTVLQLPQIPGITALDQFPRGCVDCHVNRPDLQMDVRLSTAMQQWQDKVPPAFLTKVRHFTPVGIVLEGKHPMFRAEVADIPQACLRCHAKTSKSAPPFAPLLHGLHLVGGEKNHFLSMFQGSCTHCHKFDMATGLWALGSGTEKKE